ncbi:MAG: hypothetical protein AAFY60_08820, partial [Myxococcota bacterium]
MKRAFWIGIAVLVGCSEPVALNGPLVADAPQAETAPLANAGPDAEILRGFQAVLRGGGTYHPAGLEFGARWEQIAGERVPLSNPESLEPSFIAPLDEQELIFELIVDDGSFTTLDQVVLSVVRQPSRVAPTVNGGPDRIVPLSQEAVIGSEDVSTTSGVEPVWERVTVSSSPLARVRREYDGPAVFRVTSQREGLSSAPDYVLLRRPQPDQSDADAVSRKAPTTSLVTFSDVVNPGATFVLDASGSTDSNGDPISIRWVQLRGEPAFDPSDEFELRRTVVAPTRAQELAFLAFATDGQLESAPAELRVVV